MEWINKKKEFINYYKIIYNNENNIYINLSNFKEKIAKREEILNLYNIDDQFLNEFNMISELEKKFLIDLNFYKDYNFIITISELLKKETLYNVSQLDFRGCFSPLGRILHRATGKYKYLLIYKNKYIFILNSINILKEYISFLILNKKDNFSKHELLIYFDNNFKLDKLYIKYPNKIEIIIIKILEFLQKLINDSEFKIYYNQNNNKDSEEEVNYKYFLLFQDFIGNNLYNLLLNNVNKHILLFYFYNYYKFLLENKNGNEYYSDLLLEVDQNSSGPQLYGLLSNDEIICDATNVFKNKLNIKRDIYLSF